MKKFNREMTRKVNLDPKVTEERVSYPLYRDISSNPTGQHSDMTTSSVGLLYAKLQGTFRTW